MTSAGGGTVWVEYHQWYVGDEDVLDADPTPNAAAMISPAPGGGAVMLTGVAIGHVQYTWSTHDKEPPIGDDWQDVSQAPVFAPQGRLHVIGWLGESFDEVNLAVTGPGVYMVRYSATGRDLDADLGVELAQESIHLDVWPADTDARAAVIRRK
ncbi:hypothetical protein [Cellulomonas sp. URHB0016]